MAFDKQHINNRSSRPLMATTLNPQNKSTKSPLTPRLAAPLSSPRTPVLCRNAQSSLARDASPEVLSTPVKAFLNANVTPRSNSRKARVESTSSTPVNTPDRTAVEPRSKAPSSELSFTPRQTIFNRSEPGGRSETPSLVSQRRGQSRTTSPERISGLKPDRQIASSPFFYADSTRPSWDSPKSPSDTGDVHSKASTFCYANGDRFDTAPTSPCESFVSSHTNGTQPVMEARAMGAHSPPGTSAYHRGAGDQQPPPRPASSVSEYFGNRAPHVKKPDHNHSPSRTSEPHSPAATVDSGFFTGADDTTRHPIAAGSIVGEVVAMESSHRKSMSIGSLEHNAFRQRRSDSISSGAGPKRVSLSLAPAPAPASASASARSDKDIGSTPSNRGSIASARSGEIAADASPKRRLQRMDELAASARTERKVLDLEISNSSLMAINRTLERKMRKQNAELRRFRRLSRAGRLSLASTTTSVGFSMARPLSLGGIDDLPVSSDLSEEESNLSFSEDDSVDDGSLSPGALAESDARYRDKDEKRLQLDLAKHQRLLVDSHKMNESLKRCLGWTEELIKEGKKALDYKVRVSDIVFGGRILVVDDLDDPHLDTPESSTYLTPSHATTGEVLPRPYLASPSDDRDELETSLTSVDDETESQ